MKRKRRRRRIRKVEEELEEKLALQAEFEEWKKDPIKKYIEETIKDLD